MVVFGRPFNRCFGRFAARLLAGLCSTRRTLGELFLEGGLLLLEAHAGACLDLGLCGVHGEQAVLPAFDLVGQVNSVGKCRLVGALGQCQELLHFGLELAFEHLDMAIGKCAMA